MLLVLAWTPLLWRLSRMWRAETEFVFGFGVPVLAGWLLWQRRGEWALKTEAAGRSSLWLAAAGGAVMGCALLLLEANPLWPRAGWLGVAGAVALTSGVIARGHGWRALRVAAPVLCLMFTALKWPSGIYAPVMAAMMQMNAVIAAELVSLAGTPALVHGSVIEVARGMVGVDEACSGLRSLQTVIMVAFFLGESERLHAVRRLWLLGGAMLAALLANVARTTVLTWVFANRGQAAEESWHDAAGVAALLVTLGLVWVWSARLARNEAGKVYPNFDTHAPAWRPLAAAALLALVLEAGVQAWYLIRDEAGTERVRWELARHGAPEWRRIGVPKRSAEILNYESAESFGRELEGPSRQVLAFAFRWEADLARLGVPELHDPLVCLPLIGAVKEAELPMARVEVDGVEVPFRFIRFRQGGVLQHVWFCLWSTRTGGENEERWQGRDIEALRLERVRAGRRNDEREQLIFFVQGEETDVAAQATLREAVLTLLRRR
jgi:exosortase